MSQQTVQILLIEDNPADSRLIRKLLRRSTQHRFEIEEVDRLEHGLERLARDGIDVVLADLSLPDSSPQDTYRHLCRKTGTVPLILLTGIEDEKLAALALREGAQDYLTKHNVDTPLLERAIRYAIERQHAEEALRESEERYALAVRGANDGLWDWDLRTNRIYFSPRWKEMLAYADDQIGDSPDEWFKRIHPNDMSSVHEGITAHVQGQTSHFQREYRILNRHGDYRWMLSRGLAVRDPSGRASRMAGSQTDITDRKLAEEQLLHDAFHDILTGLPNRALFMDRLGLAIAQARRARSRLFAVLFLDLDQFKNINDSLGHSIGDRLLKAFGQKLSRFLRPGDTVARMGGDEFAILLNDIGETADATRIAERVQRDLDHPFNLSGYEVFTSASIGITLSSTGYRNAEEVLRDADTAMYRAKSRGRGTHEIFDRSMHVHAVELLQVENDLRRAVERQEFRLHYQPIIGLETGRIVGLEALLRWQHPLRGLLHPADFVSIAEETGIIVPIGWWVLHEACRQMRAWQEQIREPGDLSVSVNLSGKQFIQPDLVSRIEATLRATGLDPSSLRLEITESLIMANAESAVGKLQTLRRLGIQVHIDDFGTGYSSLSYLHSLPTDTLKIDRSFITNLHEGDGKSEIVRTIVALARQLGMKVAAEGLETADQYSQMKTLSCEFGQGYFFSRPLDGQAASVLIAAKPQW